MLQVLWKKVLHFEERKEERKEGHNIKPNYKFTFAGVWRSSCFSPPTPTTPHNSSQFHHLKCYQVHLKKGHCQCPGRRLKHSTLVRYDLMASQDIWLDFGWWNNCEMLFLLGGWGRVFVFWGKKSLCWKKVFLFQGSSLEKEPLQAEIHGSFGLGTYSPEIQESLKSRNMPWTSCHTYLFQLPTIIRNHFEAWQKEDDPIPNYN